MAFLNYIGTGTYTIVDEFIYSKEQKMIRCTLYVFEDNTKATLLASKQYSYWFDSTKPTLLEIHRSTPPENPWDGDQYLIAQSDAQGVWATREGQLAVWKDDMQDWSYWFVAPDQEFYCPADQLYYRVLDEQGNIATSNFALDSRVWDAWFAKDKVITDEENNLYKQFYLFLKTQPGFENVADG